MCLFFVAIHGLSKDTLSRFGSLLCFTAKHMWELWIVQHAPLQCCSVYTLFHGSELVDDVLNLREF